MNIDRFKVLYIKFYKKKLSTELFRTKIEQFYFAIPKYRVGLQKPVTSFNKLKLQLNKIGITGIYTYNI